MLLPGSKVDKQRAQQQGRPGKDPFIWTTPEGAHGPPSSTAHAATHRHTKSCVYPHKRVKRLLGTCHIVNLKNEINTAGADHKNKMVSNGQANYTDGKSSD